MTEAAVKLLDDDAILLRRTGVRFPVELRPAGFEPDDLSTWPDVDGRLEWVDGRLLYMPPCADVQQDVAADVVHVLRSWSDTHPEFVVGGNEAGMKLGEDIRAADAAVWRAADVGRSIGKLRRAPPLLAVEVAGADEDEPVLRVKAHWYLDHGATVVWIVLPEPREVLVIRRDRESRHSRGQRLPLTPQLPDLAPDVDRLFVQIDRRR
ncbi:MAG TPA: Uma2 family endonuclease [Gammaproteobacteria bacterium]|nr:Uma2 family endonuclease [Gammaproteobacteria bacterium]